MKTPYQHSGVAMADNKGSAELETGSDKDGWGQDVRDMHRLGKKEVDLGYCIGAMSNMGCRQEFTRNFGMISPSLVLCPKNSAYDVFVHVCRPIHIEQRNCSLADVATSLKPMVAGVWDRRISSRK